MTRMPWFPVFVAMLYVQGCALRLESSNEGLETAEPGKETEELLEERPSNVYAAKPKSVATPGVVIALMSVAERQSSDGNLDQAAATIERALRIQPRNPELWYRLAKLRFHQDQPKAAIDLAMKSKSLSGTNGRLKKQNWVLIAKARRQVGDVIGASEAMDKASGL